MRRGRRLITLGIASAMLLSVSAVAPTSAAVVRFGAKLSSTTQPANSGTTGWWCDGFNAPSPHPLCSWVMRDAYDRGPSGHKAPKNGTVDKVRVVSCRNETLALQIGKINAAGTKARVLRNGPTISTMADADCDVPYSVRVVNVDFHINQGEVIVVKTRRTGALSCSSGGDHTWLYDPPLVAGASFRTRTDTPGNCYLLVEYQYE